MSETLAARAQATLHDWVQSESLRKHCYAVADSMKYFAQSRGEDADLWEAVGLLHDMDYERHPIAVAGVSDPGYSRPPVCRRRVATRERLEWRSVPRDSFARRLLRRFARNAARENA